MLEGRLVVAKRTEEKKDCGRGIVYDRCRMRRISICKATTLVIIGQLFLETEVLTSYVVDMGVYALRTSLNISRFLMSHTHMQNGVGGF
jgi:hypothetical protein